MEKNRIMQPSTKTRIILLDDIDSIRDTFAKLLTIHGYEVFSFSNPTICPLQIEPECRCNKNQTCTDIIISDLDMPSMTGLNFIENQRKKNCKCQHVALMSGLWTEEKLSHAHELGCKIFMKPVSAKDILKWIEEVEKYINPDRELCGWFEETPLKVDEYKLA